MRKGGVRIAKCDEKRRWGGRAGGRTKKCCYSFPVAAAAVHHERVRTYV